MWLFTIGYAIEITFVFLYLWNQFLRIAGLKATEASMTLFDMNQICTRLIPQISLLLLDKSHDVNEVTFSFEFMNIINK